MVRITILLPEENKEALEQIAQEEERNLSWVVRKAIQQYLDSKVYCQEEKEN